MDIKPILIGEIKLANNLKLAVTKAGDLLLNDKITKDEDGKTIDNINLVIPSYQRPYKWTAKNVIQLLDDILEAKNQTKEVYRVGTLILHQEKDSDFNIVDGQQRTITFALLLKALGDDEEGKIKFLEQPLTENPHNLRNIPSNYRALERRIKNINETEKEEILEYVKKNCELIVVITKDISEAFQFFDSQNSRGKKLYPHDLLKAFHLREMSNLDAAETERVVKIWEDLDQKKLSILFSDYLYRIKEWTKGKKALELTEKNIHKFKGITQNDNFPYAQFYKGAFAYTEAFNTSSMPFVSGAGNLKQFQLDTPIVAGKAFFDFSKHYFEILTDIQNNDKYEGHFINGNEIVKTLDLTKYKNGVGNKIVRLLFDVAILLYVDRFCCEKPVKKNLDLLDQFVLFAFIWAYSLRAQYLSLGWQTAQNFIMGNKEKTNSFNIYIIITEADSPASLLSTLSEKLSPLQNKNDFSDEKINEVYQDYLMHFANKNFLEKKETDNAK